MARLKNQKAALAKKQKERAWLALHRLKSEIINIVRNADLGDRQALSLVLWEAKKILPRSRPQQGHLRRG